MKSVLKKIFILFFAFILIVLAYAPFRPDVYYIQRSISINAAPEKIFNYLNDVKLWKLWFNIPENLKDTYSEPSTGKGATYTYDGNWNQGSGRSIIVESIKPGRIVIDLDMTKPFGSYHSMEYTIKKEKDHSEVTSLMIHRNNYYGKLIHIFIDIDSFIGPMIEQNLLKLKNVAEKQVVEF